MRLGKVVAEAAEDSSSNPPWFLEAHGRVGLLGSGGRLPGFEFRQGCARVSDLHQGGSLSRRMLAVPAFGLRECR